MCGALFCQGETSTDLDTFGPKSESCQHGAACSDASGSHQGERRGAAHGGDQAESRGLFATVMSAGFKTFGDYGIDTCLFTFDGKFGTTDDMGDFYPVFFQESRPCFGVAGRGENDLYVFLH